MNYEKFDVCPITNEKCIPTCRFRFQNIEINTHMEDACALIIGLSNKHTVVDRMQYEELLKAYEDFKAFDGKYGHLVKAFDLDKKAPK